MLALLLLPALALLVGALVVPSALLLRKSFLVSLGYGLVENVYTIHNYVHAFAGPNASVYRTVAYNALGIGALNGLMCTALAYPVAYFINFRLTRGRNLLLFLVVASLFASYLVRLYAWRTILGTNGMINDGLRRLGLIHHPLLFLLFSRWAVLIALVNIFLPFTILIVTSAMQNVPRDLLDNARDLGASPLRTFSRVVLPLTMTGAVAAFAYTFILSAGDYITPQMLGGTSGLFIGNIVSDQFVAAGNAPLGAAISFIVLAVFAGTFLALKRLERWKGF